MDDIGRYFSWFRILMVAVTLGREKGEVLSDVKAVEKD
jgi:hypothetical protein